MPITQNMMEHLLHKKHVTFSLLTEIQKDLPDHVAKGIDLIKDYLSTPMWASAERRKDAIRLYDIESLVLDIYTTITMTCQQSLPLVSIASMINLSPDLDKLDNIQLAADLIALLKDIRVFALDKTPHGTILVTSTILPSDEVVHKMKLGCYLPPMVAKPDIIETNTDSGYKTVNKDSLILGGKTNDHSGNISIDVINTMNATAYELDTHVTDMEKDFHRDYLTPQEIAALDYEDQEKYHTAVNTFATSREQFDYLKQLLTDRTIYFTHKPDKRGRMYSQGYHFNVQGTSYEKASLNLMKKELITGEL